MTAGVGFVSNPSTVGCILYEGDDLPCAVGTYSESGVGPDGDCPNSCPSDRPTTSSTGALSIEDCVPPPEECIQVEVDGCAGTLQDGVVTGVFDVFDGECDHTAGRRSYFREDAGQYLYVRASAGRCLCSAASLKRTPNADSSSALASPAGTSILRAKSGPSGRRAVARSRGPSEMLESSRS